MTVSLATTVLECIHYHGVRGIIQFINFRLLLPACTCSFPPNNIHNLRLVRYSEANIIVLPFCCGYFSIVSTVRAL